MRLVPRSELVCPPCAAAVTIVGGIFLSEITVILRNPRSIITILGCQLPVVAIYFMQVRTPPCPFARPPV